MAVLSIVDQVLLSLGYLNCTQIKAKIYKVSLAIVSGKMAFNGTGLESYGTLPQTQLELKHAMEFHCLRHIGITLIKLRSFLGRVYIVCTWMWKNRVHPSFEPIINLRMKQNLKSSKNNKSPVKVLFEMWTQIYMTKGVPRLFQGRLFDVLYTYLLLYESLSQVKLGRLSTVTHLSLNLPSHLIKHATRVKVLLSFH